MALGIGEQAGGGDQCGSAQADPATCRPRAARPRATYAVIIHPEFYPQPGETKLARPVDKLCAVPLGERSTVRPNQATVSGGIQCRANRRPGCKSAVTDFCCVASSARCCAGHRHGQRTPARADGVVGGRVCAGGHRRGGCALLALLRPQAALDHAQIVMGRESGALYVRVGDTWHPVLNLASARLIAATDANPQPVRESELSRTKRGPLLGIPGAPQLLGPPLSADESAWTICDTDSDAATTVVVGPAEARPSRRLASEQRHPGRARLGFAGLPALQRTAGRGGSRRHRGGACAAGWRAARRSRSRSRC